MHPVKQGCYWVEGFVNKGELASVQKLELCSSFEQIKSYMKKWYGWWDRARGEVLKKKCVNAPEMVVFNSTSNWFFKSVFNEIFTFISPQTKTWKKCGNAFPSTKICANAVLTCSRRGQKFRLTPDCKIKNVFGPRSTCCYGAGCCCLRDMCGPCSKNLGPCLRLPDIHECQRLSLNLLLKLDTSLTL